MNEIYLRNAVFVYNVLWGNGLRCVVCNTHWNANGINKYTQKKTYEHMSFVQKLKAAHLGNMLSVGEIILNST